MSVMKATRLSPDAFAVAARRLSSNHPELKELIRRVGAPQLGVRAPSAFQSLARSIVYQQLAGAAAQTIWRRVLAQTGTPITSVKLAACSDEELRACGLSAAKLLALRDLSRLAPSLHLGAFHRLSDDEIIARLVAVRGIGRWTAEMFLIFHLRRLDVWPAGDLGVKEGIRRLFSLPQRPSDKEMETWGQSYAPYRSVAAWYMWRVLD